MYNISARRATESDYGLITKDNKPLEFETERSQENGHRLT
jgi:hypothetical protein